MNMRVIGSNAIAVGTVCLTLLMWSSGNLLAQEPTPGPTIKIRFKAFDSNDPAKRLSAAPFANNFVRDPATKKAVFLERVVVSRPGGEADFDEIEVSRGWLIEQLVIQVSDPARVYNPAILTKIVSNADMTIYPGASQSTDVFSTNAYVAQMQAYRTLLAQLLDEVDPTLRESVRSNLRAAFTPQLLNMANIGARLANPSPADVQNAKRVRDEVLKLYGFVLPPTPAGKGKTYCPCQVSCPCRCICRCR